MLDSLLQQTISFLGSFSPPVISFILGFLPISEIRGAAIYAFQQGNQSLMLYGIAGNICAAICLILLWDFLHIEKIGRMIVGKRIEKMIENYHKNHELGETIALAIFIGIPLPMTGAYSGVLVGKILQISDKKLLISSTAGILAAGLITFLVLNGTLSFLYFLVK